MQPNELIIPYFVALFNRHRKVDAPHKESAAISAEKKAHRSDCEASSERDHIKTAA